MFKLNSTLIEGCYNIENRAIDDSRGRFVKVFNARAFAELGMDVTFREQYYSCSRKGVVRGLHFQTPPHQHAKLVYCSEGEVMDVVLDLRVGSPSYGKTDSFVLSSKKGNSIYMPAGLAHGFCSLSDNSILIYNVTSEYSPDHDDGVLWSSVGINWPTSSPIVSDRDSSFKLFSEIESVFKYGENC